MMYFGVLLKRHAAELLSVGGKSLSFVSRKDNRFFFGGYGTRKDCLSFLRENDLFLVSTKNKPCFWFLDEKGMFEE